LSSFGNAADGCSYFRDGDARKFPDRQPARKRLVDPDFLRRLLMLACVEEPKDVETVGYSLISPRKIRLTRRMFVRNIAAAL